MEDWRVVDAIHAADQEQLARYVRALALRLSDGELVLPAEWDHDPDYRAGLQKLVQAATAVPPAQGCLYRYKTPTKTGRWCTTIQQAREAAVRANVAHKDEDGRVFLDVFTEIETKELRT